jgi:asparagine synthetase B (glutamine-hydrolysing)
MTLFAGIFSRRDDEPLTDSVCERLHSVISRDANDSRQTFRDSRCFFVKVDTGAFGEPGFHLDSDSAVSMITGEPLLNHTEADSLQGRLADSDQGRLADLQAFHNSWLNDDFSLLEKARGTFSAAHYRPATGRLVICSDKVGVRPIYYFADDRFFIFASALRVLESLDEVPLIMDVRALAELTGLGYPLAHRTPYAGISMLRAGELVKVERNAIKTSQYFRWDDIEQDPRSEADQLDEAHDIFARAVQLRNRADKTTVAYLSGGLDSRCAVAALRAMKVDVHTFNFALPGTQDYVFGNEFAEKTGTLHTASPKEHGDLTPDYSELLAESELRHKPLPERPKIAWSGEGGSVALGHVHLSGEVVDLLRAGRTDEAIDTFLKIEGASVTRRLLQPDINSAVGDALQRGIREELDWFRCADPARSFYLFLLLNDQRRKLTEHFEYIDFHRLEFQLPFFDAEFLALIVSLPIDSCLRHGFYTKWLTRFSPVVTQVPWQTYPGHKPCPVPIKADVAYQWDAGYQKEQQAVLRRELLKQARQILRSPYFPDWLLKKSFLRLATLIYRTGLRDYSYVIQTASKFHWYARLCKDEYLLPKPPADADLNSEPILDSKRNGEFRSIEVPRVTDSRVTPLFETSKSKE